MRNKFTKQAQTALTLAKAAAIDFELGYIGTEHLLLGLLSETEGAAGRVLEEFQVDGKKLVELIDKLVTPAEVGNVTEIEMKPAYSPRTEKVLESAVAEAQNSGCEKAGTVLGKAAHLQPVCSGVLPAVCGPCDGAAVLYRHRGGRAGGTAAQEHSVQGRGGALCHGAAQLPPARPEKRGTAAVGKGPGLFAESLHGDLCGHHRHLVFAEL